MVPRPQGIQQSCYIASGRTSVQGFGVAARTRRVKRRPRADWQQLIEWLQATMDLHRMKTPDLAKASDIPATTLYGLLNGEHQPRLETLEKLARHFGQPLHVMKLMAGMPSEPGALREVMPAATFVPGTTETLLIPMIGSVSAGGGYVPEGYAVFGPIRGASKNLVAFRARGDCMEPEIRDDDLLVIDLNGQWEDGHAVLVRVGDELMVKYAYRLKRGFRLVPSNPSYEPIVSEDADVLGVVVATQTSMRLRFQTPPPAERTGYADPHRTS